MRRAAFSFILIVCIQLNCAQIWSWIFQELAKANFLRRQRFCFFYELKKFYLTKSKRRRSESNVEIMCGACKCRVYPLLCNYRQGAGSNRPSEPGSLGTCSYEGRSRQVYNHYPYLYYRTGVLVNRLTELVFAPQLAFRFVDFLWNF